MKVTKPPYNNVKEIGQDSLVQHLLVVQCDIWPPDETGFHSNSFNSTVFTYIPCQVGIYPVLPKKNKNHYLF